MGGPGESIVMPPPPAGLLGPGQGMGAPVPGGGPPPIAPNGQGIGNGFAPPASFERRPGMPRPAKTTSEESTKISAEESANLPDTVGPRKREEREDDVLHSLPRAKKRRSYTLIEGDKPDDEPVAQEHEDNQPPRPASDED